MVSIREKHDMNLGLGAASGVKRVFRGAVQPQSEQPDIRDAPGPQSANRGLIIMVASNTVGSGRWAKRLEGATSYLM